MPHMLGAVVNMNQPGRYLHWSIFTVSVANLALIAVMVLIFGAALVVRFPHAPQDDTESDGGEPAGITPDRDPAVASSWTAAIRNRALALLPPGKLLPDRQPAYVSSWVYVFGVASLATLALAIASGAAIALGGVDWWHTNAVGHFFNSLHLWSVELFMAFIVIHLWGKFWMAAWRGRRRLTWITGVVAFVASIVECFTGYLSQQNFDSQWISTSGKDAFNSVGIGAFFNLMNFGQMLLWHIVLIPVLLVALVGAHILLVRVRGVVPPLGEPPHGRRARRTRERSDAAPWRGRLRRYDIAREAVVASLVASLLVVLLAGLLSSPDVPPVTVATWAKVAPADFLGTAASELAGTSETATYGPPYNHENGSVQTIGFSWQLMAGVVQPIDAAKTFVLSPLEKVSATDPPLRRALRAYDSGTHRQQRAWAEKYLTAEARVKFVNGSPVVPATTDGPVPLLLSEELTLARSGAIDADLLAQQPFYGTDYTKPLLFLEDGNYFSTVAQADHLTGAQWGVMNETGSYPGQPWLWLYTLWYQVPGFSSSANVDLIAIYMTGLATLLLLAVPFIPGLRSLPRLIPIHRLVWRDWYRSGSDVGPPREREQRVPPPMGPDGRRGREIDDSAPVNGDQRVADRLD